MTTLSEPTYRVLPTDNGPVPLADEIGALERDLGLRGYTDAVNHYRQAVNNFGQHQYEAANGHLRTMFEALVIGLATNKAGYVGAGGPAKEAEPSGISSALAHSPKGMVASFSWDSGI